MELGWQKGTFWDNKKVLCLDCDGDYMNVPICQNSINYTFKVLVYCRMNISIYITFQKDNKK